MLNTNTKPIRAVNPAKETAPKIEPWQPPVLFFGSLDSLLDEELVCSLADCSEIISEEDASTLLVVDDKVLDSELLINEDEDASLFEAEEELYSELILEEESSLLTDEEELLSEYALEEDSELVGGTLLLEIGGWLEEED